MSKSGNGKDLMQILLNIVIIGLFSIVENCLLFYYNGSWYMPVIFSVLSVLMYCVLAINIYNCIHDMQRNSASKEEVQMQAMLLEQMKKMEKEMEELKMNQLRSTKAILMKEEEIENYLQR